ncbi:TetR/AcrR family transcriptional regulator [Microbacterium invictum]|uniref:TetR/AcrR family transcriptional regulator n=1 Tax=Microbacterium invictum TaxID=515415 RepID=A0ABZ0V928_9MICO|nr:TetR/AcrR family transcriptional regulator [Microbacterium invictum]WQB69831.1 TetR/AcrR family transcriptional regulator [Microbacterium invictum]
MGSRHSREEILDGAVRVLLERGVSGLSFASVGDALGIADRTVVYYFPTKAHLLQAAVEAGSVSLRDLLGAAFGTDALPPADLIERAWPVISSAEAHPWMRVYLELIGASARGDEPHRSLARSITESWIAWVAERVAAATPADRLREAQQVVAAIDGRLVIHTLGIEA